MCTCKTSWPERETGSSRESRLTHPPRRVRTGRGYSRPAGGRWSAMTRCSRMADKASSEASASSRPRRVPRAKHRRGRQRRLERVEALLVGWAPRELGTEAAVLDGDGLARVDGGAARGDEADAGAAEKEPWGLGLQLVVCLASRAPCALRTCTSASRGPLRLGEGEHVFATRNGPT